MAYDRETLEQVAEIFRQRRANAVERLQARREEVYKKIPRIREIDAQTKDRYRELVSGIFGGKTLTKSEIRSSSVDLRAERAELLATNGYPIDYLEVKFECRRCSDEGFVKGPHVLLLSAGAGPSRHVADKDIHADAGPVV